MCVINVVARTRALRARNIHIHLQPAMWIFFLIIFIFFPHSEFGRQYEVNANKNKGTKMRTTRNCVRPAVKKNHATFIITKHCFPFIVAFTTDKRRVVCFAPFRCRWQNIMHAAVIILAHIVCV